MGFRNLRAWSDTYENGQQHVCTFRKVPSQATTSDMWADLSMAAGNPVPNYYASAPLVAATLDGFRGIFHGDAKAPATKHVHSVELTTPTAALVGPYKLLDYVLYYPFVDLDNADYQTFDNTVPLPRFTTGDGVLAMLVAAAPTVGGGSFTFDYISQAGVARTSPVIRCATGSTSIASLVTSLPGTAAAQGPLLPLADGDTGIRRVLGWQNLTLNGGLGTLVLVRPLWDYVIREANTPSALHHVVHCAGAPPVADGAYLNLIMRCGGSIAAGQLMGSATFTWN